MQNTPQDPNISELIDGPENDRRRLTELLESIKVGPEVDAIAEQMREKIWADVRKKTLRQTLRMRIMRYSAAATIGICALCGSWITAYHVAEMRIVAAAQPVSISTPKGVKSDILLPDGSRVRLNGGTRITYPALFGDQRRVEIDGEAYFEVTHNAKKPFVVVTGQVTSTVLGTTFNVHAYSEDENIQITLASGSLQVDGGPQSRKIILQPGEQGFFDKESKLLSQHEVNLEHELSWREGKLYFRGERLASIARSLERQFNVSISIDDERLRRTSFTGEFLDGENIQEIMRIISADSRILYRCHKNHYELYRNL